MKVFLTTALLILAHSSLAGPFEELTGLQFGVSPSDVRAAVEAKGGHLPEAKGQKNDEMKVTNVPVAGRGSRSVNLRFRSNRLAGCFTILEEESGKPVIQQYRDTVRFLETKLGAPSAIIGANIENPTAKQAAKNISGIKETIWQLPNNGNLAAAQYVLCAVGATGDGKSLFVKLNFVSGEFSPPSDLTTILGRIASGSNISPSSSPLALPVAPATQPLPAPTGSPAAISVLPTKPAITLVLLPAWNTPMQGGTKTLEDLSRLFSAVAKPGANLAADPTIEVYEGVAYLTPFQKALKPLGITNQPPSRNQVTCPGFPRDSFFYYAVDGTFEGHYNRMYVVVDRADQVVAVQLVDETPREKPQYFQSKVDWTTYNFVNARSKAMSKLRIDHKLYGKTKTGWSLGNQATDTKMFRIDSFLLSPEDKYGNRWDLKEQVRWYVPKPMVELILTCVKAGGR